MTINLDEELDQGGDFERLPEGTYEATVYEAEVKESRSGNERLNVTFKIQGGDYDDRQIWANWPLEGKGTYYTRTEFLDHVPHDLDGEVDGPAIVESVVGLPCRIRVAHEGDFRDEGEELHDDGLIAQVAQTLPPEDEQGDDADWLPE